MRVSYGGKPGISDLLENQRFETVRHVLRDVLNGKPLPMLSGNDVLLSTAGPYAWFYHYMREKEGGDFRIVRDVHNSLFVDYFLQEHLCSELTRKNDAVLFDSEYQRRLFLKLFPNSLIEKNTFVCCPGFASSLPKIIPKRSGNSLTIGYIGKLCKGENFDAAIETFIGVSETSDKDVKMMVCGHSEDEYTPGRVKKFLKSRGLEPKNYQNCNDIWKALSEMDVLLFPSMSGESMETIVLYACHAGVPVIAADHGAMPELLERGNLVPVEYSSGYFKLNKSDSLGKVDVERMIEKCAHPDKLSKKNALHRYKLHDKRFFKILKGEKPGKEGIKLSSNVERFIDNISVYIGPSLVNHTTNSLLGMALAFLRTHASHIDMLELSSKLRYDVKYRIRS